MLIWDKKEAYKKGQIKTNHKMLDNRGDLRFHGEKYLSLFFWMKEE